MSPAAQDNLLVLQRLARVGGTSDRPIHTDVPAADYDWAVPYHFSREQLVEINHLASALAEALSEVIGGHLQTEWRLQAAPAVQCFGDRLVEELAEAGGYHLSVGDGDEPRGIVLVGAGTAAEWLARLLGGEADEDKDPSQLEIDLLADTVSAGVEAVSQALREAGGGAIGCLGSLASGPRDLPGEGETEYCEMAFRKAPEDPQADETDEADEPPALTLVLHCDLLDPIAGQGAARDSREPGAASSQPGPDAMREHFARTPVTAVAMAGTAEVTMRELLDLDVGDVLLLPKRAGEPMEVHVGETPVSTGRAVVASGRYAVEISRVLSPRGDDAARGSRPA
jgi:flagellar motor switch protein FliM